MALTDEQAEEMLKQLSEHYRQPVLPVQRFCSFFNTWYEAIQKRVKDLQEELYPGICGDLNLPATQAAFEWYRVEKEKHPSEHPRQYEVGLLRNLEQRLTRMDVVRFDIQKSNFLFRLIYRQEPLRTKVCPQHKGEWSGVEFDDNVCPHGCNLTGWIHDSQEDT